MRYSESFTRDVRWYMSMRHTFSFSGKGISVTHDKKGVDGVKAFWLKDSQGKDVATKHPNILHTLLNTKGSANLHIKVYAQGQADGTLPRPEFEALCCDIKAPDWFADAVEQQKCKYYPSSKPIAVTHG